VPISSHRKLLRTKAVVVSVAETPETVAEAAGVWPRTVRKWVERYCREGLAGLQDVRRDRIGCAGRHRRR
jgi:transposase